MKEYGRKPYISKTYNEMMSKKTNRDVWQKTLEKHSEFEKPYLWKPGEYAAMQHYHPALPGLGFSDLNDFDFGFDPYDSYDPWHILFICAGDLCFCKDDTKCFSLNCSYPIVEVQPISGCEGLTFEVGNGQICITANSDPEWGCMADVIMKAKVPYTGDVRSLWKRQYMFVYGKHEARIDECDDCDPCIPDASMAWDSGTSAETVARNNSVTVAITGNNTPFTWSVSGTGFTLDNAETEGLTNTLNADDTACGSATITVTGCDDVVATGYVRCTTGGWIDCGPVFGSYQPHPSCPGPRLWNTYIKGQYKFVGGGAYTSCTLGYDGIKSCGGGTASVAEITGTAPLFSASGANRLYYWECP